MSDLFSIFHLFLGENDIVSCCCFLAFTQLCLPSPYLYYGPVRMPVYLCAFKDAYTKEILGHHVDAHMTVELVKTAYDTMMEKHGTELHRAECVIHSD